MQATSWRCGFGDEGPPTTRGFTGFGEESAQERKFGRQAGVSGTFGKVEVTLSIVLKKWIARMAVSVVNTRGATSKVSLEIDIFGTYTCLFITENYMDFCTGKVQCPDISRCL